MKLRRFVFVLPSRCYEDSAVIVSEVVSKYVKMRSAYKNFSWKMCREETI